MADTVMEAPAEAAPKSKKGMIISAVLALVLAGAGFAVTYTGILQGLLGGGESHEASATAPESPAFVPIDTITIAIEGPPKRQFRLSAQIEVPPSQAKAVAEQMPRVLNVLQGFLRAVEPDQLADRAAWFDLRLKMLYRIRMVLGEDRVRDLLITDFIVN